MRRSASFPRPRRPIHRAVHLAAAAVLAAIPVAQADAATIAVTNCANSGAGSLRNAASVAASGDVINMTGLACNRILLRSTITFPQNSITLRGPGRLALTVSAGESGRVFAHTGSGTLRVERLSVAWGRYRAVSAFGGCIYSAASLQVIRSRIHHCRVLRGGTLEPAAAGGGVFANRVLLSYSSVSDSYSQDGVGGGVFGREVTIEHSQVSNNEGGGVYTSGLMTVTYSLIHNNRGRGLDAGGSVPAEVVVRNSTISSNRGAGFGAAIHVGGYLQQTRIIHSTISGNSGYYDVLHLPPFSQVIGTTIAFNETLRDDECSEAVTMFPPASLLVGSIVARNTCLGGAPADIRAWVEPDYNWGTLPGGRNLIGVAEGPVPGDTIFGNPLLGPLADNGGPTPTHLPASNSPAIDSGSNLYAEPYDQRGPDFLRTKDAIPDIGAVER